MIRVLHLLDAGPDYQTETGARQLAGDSSGAFAAEARTIGKEGTYSSAPVALLHLRRNRQIDRFDVVHAWGGRAMTVAALASRRSPIVFSPDRFPGARDVRWARSVAGARDVHVVTPTDTMRRAFVTRGFPIERCHLIRPGVEFAQIKRRRDDALRPARIRAGRLRDARGRRVDARGAHALSVWAASILHVLDPEYRLLLWGRGPLARQAERFAHRTRQHGLMEVAQRELKRPVRFEELLAATDAVLVTATAPAPTLPVAVCMAAALPIVALVTPTVAELLEDRHTALMVGKPAPRIIAQRVLDLRHDPGLQWTISDMARTEAYEYFSLTRFLNQWRAVYRQVASGEKVEVPQQAPGAGLRFHGRV